MLVELTEKIPRENVSEMNSARLVVAGGVEVYIPTTTITQRVGSSLSLVLLSVRLIVQVKKNI